MNVEEKPGYTVFEVAECPEAFEYLTVGPIVTALNDTVGDVGADGVRADMGYGDGV